MPASTRLPWFFFLLAVAPPGCGCGSDPNDRQPDAEPPSDSRVELGTGTTSFQPIGEESDLVLVAGPQGGHHFIVHARIHGMSPGDPTMPGQLANPATHFTVTDEDGVHVEVNASPYRLGYERDGDAYVLPSGRIVQVREETVPALYGSRAHIEVEVTDSAGETASDSRWVLAIEEPPALR